ncbi:glycosyltransferase family 2 protein [Noviherbaspirillum soli]|uniref:glycosyltransferase family 2 protein n=1 Tax=Noviherbaspirillum soli TaxID=1064518 RepID=UPI002B2773D5|nr:glycosyltransferase [Noviherbaspirillum soli]
MLIYRDVRECGLNVQGVILNQQPNVSLVIPTHNRASLVVHTVQSALDQTVPFAEIIVVDDASTDDTLVQLRRFGQRIRVIPSKKIGVQAARNLGVATATSKYVTLCDSDDLLQPEFLHTIGGLLAAHPEIDSIYSNYQSFCGEKVAEDILSGAPKGFLDGGNVDGDLVTDIPDLYAKTIVFQPLMPTGATIKKLFYESIGGFDPVFDRVPSEDWEYTLRAIANGKIAICTIPLVRIRRHEGNDSYDLLRTALGEVEVMKFVLRHHPFAQRYRNVFLEAIRKRYDRVFYESFRARRFNIAGAVFPLLENKPATYRFRLKSLIMFLYTKFKTCELHNVLQLPKEKTDVSVPVPYSHRTRS